MYLHGPRLAESRAVHRVIDVPDVLPCLDTVHTPEMETVSPNIHVSFPCTLFALFLMVFFLVSSSANPAPEITIPMSGSKVPASGALEDRYFVFEDVCKTG